MTFADARNSDGDMRTASSRDEKPADARPKVAEASGATAASIT